MNYHKTRHELDRLQAAIDKYETLKQEGNFSVPPEEGYTAVICTQTNYDDGSQQTQDELMKQNRIFAEEADMFTQRITSSGRVAEKIASNSIVDFLSVIKDPKCSDIIAIGNGSYRTVFFDDQHLTWWNASLASDHLKTGVFSQRTCAHLDERKLNVAVATFIMRDQTKISAPVGELVDNENPDERLLARQVYPKGPKNISDYIQLENPYDETNPTPTENFASHLRLGALTLLSTIRPPRYP